MKIFQGVDLVKVSRMEQLIRRSGKTFIERVFSADERAYCRSKRMRFEHYAARFAAKEAVLKALKIKPKKGLKLSGIEIKRQATGKPYLALTPQACKILKIPGKAQIELSLAHEREYAIATVVIVVP
ncbi:MAG TPA: holo-ACP synthase [Candidatus Omnitrophota bacterium]|nr:holo-ACP synthase [Candidatus Omnitrophota bacterium]HPS37751.1 holo-ACP synthase [Candidatus Omnitrophota bacterium]